MFFFLLSISKLKGLGKVDGEKIPSAVVRSLFAQHRPAFDLVVRAALCELEMLAAISISDYFCENVIEMLFCN